MPLLGPNSYLPTTREFVNHWQAANVQLAALSRPPIVLKGGVTQALLAQKVGELEGRIDGVSVCVQQEQLARAERDTLRSDSREFLRRFRVGVQYQLGGSKYATALPALLPADAKESDFRAAMTRALALWQEINGLGEDEVAGFTPPLVLGDGTTLAQATEQVGYAEATFARVESTRTQSDLARVERDQLCIGTIKPVLKLYRTAILNAFGVDHPIVASVPLLSPAPGSTPNAPVVVAHYDTQTNEAVLTWEAVPNAAHYSVRAAPGPSYRATEEGVLATLSADTTTYRTRQGLVTSGSALLVKVYTETATGNEKGCRALRIVRP